MKLRIGRYLVVGLSAVLLLLNFSGKQAMRSASMVLQTDWNLTGNMTVARRYFTLSVLPDGTALAVGGKTTGNSYLNSSEIYSPTTNQWTAVSDPLATHRSQHTATLLLDGRVLVAGGMNATGAMKTAEIYNPATQQWDTTGSMGNSRYGHTATRLLDGQVLVVGGCFTGTIPDCTGTVELYNPATGTWTEKLALPAGNARMDHTATLLQDGSVLVAGGYSLFRSALITPKTYNTAYRYYPATNTWSAPSTMDAASHGRSRHNAVLRRDGKVMIVGGYYYHEPLIGGTEENFLKTSEVYNPAANNWTDLSKPIQEVRGGMESVLDAEGNFILLGGDLFGATSDVEYLDINTPSDNWHYLFGELVVQRREHAAAVLPGGVILVAGGRDQDGVVQNTAETNRFATGDFEIADGADNYGLFESSGTLLSNGNILIAGGAFEAGTGSKPCHNHVRLWLYDIERIDDGVDMINARCNPSVTLLSDGRVVVIGGTPTTLGSTSATPGEIFNGSNWSLLTGPSLSPTVKTTLLPDGKILVMQSGGAHPYLFNPVDLSFRQTLGDTAGSYSVFTATLMKNGKVLVLGSTSSSTIEVYDPQSETFHTVEALPVNLNGHTATLMADGKVMVTGGRVSSAPSIGRNQVYLFDPVAETWTTTGTMGQGRMFHSASILPDGRVVVLGGGNSALTPGVLTSVEIYDPGARTWSPAGDLHVGSRYHQTILSLKGKLVTFGGSDVANNAIWNGEQFTFPHLSSALAMWRPTITQAKCTGCATTKQVEVLGSGFTQTWEGSSGGTAQSAANQPLVQLIRLDNGQIEWLRPGVATGDGRFLSAPLTGFPDGPVIAFVYVNGSFQGKVALLSGLNNKTYLPMLER